MGGSWIIQKELSDIWGSWRSLQISWRCEWRRKKAESFCPALRLIKIIKQKPLPQHIQLASVTVLWGVFCKFLGFFPFFFFLFSFFFFLLSSFFSFFSFFFFFCFDQSDRELPQFIYRKYWYSFDTERNNSLLYSWIFYYLARVLALWLSCSDCKLQGHKLYSVY